MGVRDLSISALHILLLLDLFLTKFCFSIHNITQSQPLSQEQTLVSPNEIFELGFFSPDNSSTQYVGIWYKGISPKTVVWVVNRENAIKTTNSRTRLTISNNGNLELFDGVNDSVWSTEVEFPSNTSVAALLDNGNLVLRDGTSGEELWQSFHHPSDTFLPGALVGSDAKTGLNSWTSYTDPSLGDFVVEISSQKPAQAFVLRNGLSPHWRSGPWGGLKFVGLPDMEALYQSPFDVAEDEQKGITYVTFNSYNSSVLQYLFISPEGELKLMQKEKGREWSMAWTALKSPCDVYGVCGPFGVCRASESPICKCFKGFAPKSYEEWVRGNWSGGCTRRTGLLCERNTSSAASQQGEEKDGFVKIQTVKIPDFHEFVNVLVPQECKTRCLNNCSCVAYAYVNGIGCLVWSDRLVDVQKFSSGGEDLFLRLSRKELVGTRHTKKIIASVAAIFTCAMISAVVVFGLRMRREKRKRNREAEKKFDSILTSLNLRDGVRIREECDQPELPVFSFYSILVATNNFDATNKLGQGGFGPVYKGKLKDGNEIAVKRLSSSSGQGVAEFHTEMALISKLQHRNLVRLIGYCVDKDEKILVYEFMPNRSLDLFIFDSRRKAQVDWATRFNIINGVARGLLYLHRESCLRVIHRDLKVSNILLDEKMNPKISDFGLARIFQGTLDLANTHRVVGTLGYMSPEYAMRGIFSEKSDVFSFGVLILEIVSGRKNTGFRYSDEHLSLIGYAWQLWSESRGEGLVEKTLCDSYCLTEALRCVHIGLLCVQDYVTDRPTMSEVVSMLSNEKERPEPRQPLFMFQSSPRSDIQPESRTMLSTNQDITSSLTQGR